MNVENLRDFKGWGPTPLKWFDPRYLLTVRMPVQIRSLSEPSLRLKAGEISPHPLKLMTRPGGHMGATHSPRPPVAGASVWPPQRRTSEGFGVFVFLSGVSP